MQKLRKNPLLFPALVVLRSIVMVLYSAPELLMIQQVNFIYLLRRLCCFHLKSFISRYWYISFISRVWYPLFQGWIVLRSIVMVLYSAPELLMIQRANFAKSQISSLQLRKIWHYLLAVSQIENSMSKTSCFSHQNSNQKNLRNSNAFLTTIPTRKSESDRSRCHWKSSKMYLNPLVKAAVFA